VRTILNLWQVRTAYPTCIPYFHGNPDLG